MTTSDLAGKPAEASMLVDMVALIDAYYGLQPDAGVAAQRVAFGTSAVTVARRSIRPSTRTTSSPRPRPSVPSAARRASRARCSSGVTRTASQRTGLAHRARGAGRCRRRRPRRSGRRLHADAGHLPRHPDLEPGAPPGALADGIVVTPSHNPPADGGFKYNPPTGGPADAAMTGAIEDAANQLLRDGLAGVARMPVASERAPQPPRYDFMGTLRRRPRRGHRYRPPSLGSGLRIGVDPLGGAAVDYWDAIAERHDIDLSHHQRCDRSHVRVHDRRLGRQDPDGPVVAVRHGPPDRACEMTSTWHSATMPTPTASVSSPRGRSAQPQSLPRRGRVLPLRRCASLGRRRRPSARRWCPRACRTASQHRWADDSTRSPSASSGSSTDCLTGLSHSAARRARACRSCVAMDSPGRPTRTASSPACWRPR